MLTANGCSSQSHPKGAVGNFGKYNYSPSIIETGNTRQVWWCSQGVNPSDSSQDTDSIYYESVDRVTLETQWPMLVLAETPGAWDSAFVCNPKVIGGVFENPFHDGNTYKYAMYYVATNLIDGLSNSIGVAFSNDGIQWRKYPQPVIRATTNKSYAAAQPSVYNRDHKAGIYMLYEDTNPTFHNLAASSSDGIHFTVEGVVTTEGLDSSDLDGSWGDVAYDSKAGEWYAAFNLPGRPSSMTGGVVERGNYGVKLYKIRQDSLLTGAASWQQLTTIDTNSTGYESNFLAGFVRDPYGTLNVASYPAIEMYMTISYPATSWDATPEEAGKSGAQWQWILFPMKWVPNAAVTAPLNRYFNGSVHEVTTGWISPDGNFTLEQVLGHLYTTPLDQATRPFYGCKRGRTDYFVSLDVNCEGQRVLGTQGYAYSQPEPDRNLLALYRCSTGQDHFVSHDPKCEGETTDYLLGYVVP
jgi:hypothetical protein